ncbi:MAG: HAMP domain-containing sensor histidine kinase [Candidatus Delongbacteria bacterium]
MTQSIGPVVFGGLTLALLLALGVGLWLDTRSPDGAANPADGFWHLILHHHATDSLLALSLVVLLVVLVTRHRQRGLLLLRILEHDVTALAMRDTRGRFLFANHEFQRLLGSPESGHLLAILGAAGPNLDESWNVEQRWMRLQSRPVWRGQRELGSLIVITDETAQRQAGEGQRFRAFAGLVTHELKTPMTPLRLGLDQIQREVERLQRPLPETLQRVLGRMRADLDTMSRLLRQFMALAGERRVQERFDLKLPLEAALERTGVRQLPLVGCICRLPEGPAWVEGDPEMMTMVLSGLLANALEAISRQGRLEIELLPDSASAPQACWSLTLLDDGRGIAPHDRRHIWEPGYSTRKDGYGYGLYFARNTILDMNGQISLTSPVGGGALMRILLPVAGAGSAPRPVASFPAAEESASR